MKKTLLFLKMVYMNPWMWFMIMLLVMPWALVLSDDEPLPWQIAAALSAALAVGTRKFLWRLFGGAVYLVLHGVEVEATVTGVGACFRGHADLVFTFVVDGRKYTGSGSYPHVPVGHSMRLLVSPEDPGIHIRI